MTSVKPQVCLICLKRFRNKVSFKQSDHFSPTDPLSPVGTLKHLGSDDGTIWISRDDRESSNQNDLYVRFLHFSSRYLNLRATTKPFLEGLKEHKTGEEEAFCGSCRVVVRNVCDIYMELEVVRMRLVWKLSQFGGKLETSKGTVSCKVGKKLAKGISEELHIEDTGKVETFRKALELKCIGKGKYCSVRPIVPRGLFPERWHFTLSATREMLTRLITVYMLGSPDIHSMKQKALVPKNEIVNFEPESNEKDTIHIKEELNDDWQQEEGNFGESDNDFPAAVGDDGVDGSDWFPGAASPASMASNDLNVLTPDCRKETPRNLRANLRKRRMKSEPEPSDNFGMEAEDTSAPKLSKRRRSRKDQPKDGTAKKTRQPRKIFKGATRTIPNRTPDLQDNKAPLKQTRGTFNKCLNCRESFANRHLLLEHLESVHETELEDKLIPCWFCPRKFALKQTVKVHRSSRHSHHKFCCEILKCGKEFQNVQRLENHYLNEHLSEFQTESLDSAEPSTSTKTSETAKMRLSHCSICNWSFISSDLLELHLLNHNEVSDTNLVRCPKCTDCFSKYSDLRLHYDKRHIKFIHRYYCTICDTQLQTSHRHRFNLHMRRHKSVDSSMKLQPDGSLSCSECPFTTTNPILFKDHYNDEHLKLFPCLAEGCKKIFDRKLTLQRHTNRMHEQKGRHFKCPKCEATFAEQIDVDWHNQKVHAERTFICEDCGRAFKHAFQLKNHKLNLHNSERTEFICAECGMSYKSGVGLKFHIGSVHTPESEKKFGCPYCPRRYHRKMLLRMHVKTCVKVNGMKEDATDGATG